MRDEGDSTDYSTFHVRGSTFHSSTFILPVVRANHAAGATMAEQEKGGAMTTVRRILCVAILAAAPTAVFAEDYPSRPVRLLVAFAPGSPTDLVARVVGQNLGETFGKPIVVENRPGAGGIIASQTTKRANPDGYTILVTSTSVVTNV